MSFNKSSVQMQEYEQIKNLKHEIKAINRSIWVDTAYWTLLT